MTDQTLRTRIFRSLLALVLGFAVTWGIPGQALADHRDDGDDDDGRRRGQNYAIAVNTEDGESVVEFSFDVVEVRGDTIDQENLALAVASCEQCRTVAVAFQIVVVMDDPSTVTPTNLALAINVECTDCETLASAYQFVVGGEGIRLTDEGERALRKIRKAIKRLLKDAEDMTLDEIQAELDAIAEEVKVILATELEATGPEGTEVDDLDDEDDDDDGTDDDDGDDDDDDDGGDDTPAGVTTTPSPSPSPAAGESPAGSPSPTTEASPSPSPTSS